jgi:dCMP deaminase
VRLPKDEYFMAMALIAKMRSTCIRRNVGCVLVSDDYHVLSTGYNGGPAGVPHCIDSVCPREGVKSGDRLDICEAIHAEQNALLQCPDTQKIEVAYITASPCAHCIKLLMNTSCKRIVFGDKYPGYEELEYRWINSSKDYTRIIEQCDAVQVKVNYEPNKF